MTGAKIRMPRALLLGPLAVVLVTLAGCDLFLSAKLGRWNVNDPSNTLVDGSITLTPQIDGFVHGMTAPYTTYNRVFADTFLQYSDWFDGANSGQCFTLMSFDLSGIPQGAVVQSAVLTVTFDMLGGGGTDMNLARIARAWDPATIEFEEVTSGSFVTGVMVWESLPTAAGPWSVDVTEIVNEWLSGSPNYGIAMVAYMAAMENRSFSSENGSNGPKLAVRYKAIPE